MKARVIETGEIIDVKRRYSDIYSRFDKNNRIAEEYYDDELELIGQPDKPKKVSVEKACRWIETHIPAYYGYASISPEIINDFKKAMEE